MAVPEMVVPDAPLATTPPVPRTEAREPAPPVDSPGPFTPVPNAPLVPVAPHAAGALPEVPTPALAAAPAASVVESMVAADGSWRPTEPPAPVLPDVRPGTRRVAVRWAGTALTSAATATTSVEVARAR